jgi:acetyl esterase/lipase
MYKAFENVYYMLEDNQAGFDLLDETTLYDNPMMSYRAREMNGGLQAGEQNYKMVIIPGAYTFSLEAMQTLEEMVLKGGVLVATHRIPEEELQGQDSELKSLIEEMFGEHPDDRIHRYGKGWTAFAESEGILPVLLGRAGVRLVTMENPNPDISVIKRQRTNAIVYLLMNEGEDTADLSVTFKEDKTPEIWNPENGICETAPVYSNYGPGIRLSLRLEPHQTKVVVFPDDKPTPEMVPHLTEAPVDVISVKVSSDRSISAEILSGESGDIPLEGSYLRQSFRANLSLTALPDPIQLDGKWEMSFMDQPEKKMKTEPGSWTEIRAGYSGETSYSTRFKIPAGALSKDWQWHLDLGKVHDVARIEINGQMLEPLLWPPYSVDITPYLQPGRNSLQVFVSNTLANKHGEEVPSGIIGPVSLKPKHYSQVELQRSEDSGYQPITMPQKGYQSGEPITTKFIYRKVGDAALQMKVWYPPQWHENMEKLPAIVFIFGGGWYAGDIAQFNTLAPYLAKRGMIVLTPEYRTHRDGAPPDICLEDAKSAMRYIYSHAGELGIDPTMIAAGGRSAGGHLAAAAAFARGFDAPGDDPGITCKPSALVLFNPVIDNGPGGFRHNDVKDYWEDFSPLHTISANPPPTIFITGDRDQYTPIETAWKYKAEMERQGGRCDMVIHKDGVHGSPFAPQFYDRTVKTIDEFLVGLNYLEPID